MQNFFAVFVASLCVAVHGALPAVGQSENLPADSSRPEPAQAETAKPLNEHLSFFEPLLEKTFRGEFAGSTPEKPVVDVSRYERAMNGQAVRMLHSINDGEYGGETIFMWDAKQKKVAFWYFTTAGFRTEGTMDIDGKQGSSLEEVSGNEGGITKVRATTEHLGQGEFRVSSEYFSNGKWSPGRETLYKPAPDAKVVFK